MKYWYRLRNRCLRPLWDSLTGWVPVTTYLVSGPPGGGPWFPTPKEAADFIEEQSLMDDDNPRDCLDPVVIHPINLELLRRGDISFSEWDGWRIERISVPKRDLGKEWSGW